MTHLRFVQRPIPLGRKTPIFEIYSTEGGGVIGKISWFSNWRQYVLDTFPNTIWSHDCLDEVSQFIKQLMAERKK